MSSQISSSDVRWRSHWLRQALAVEADLAAPLEGDATADVCIVGGGYLGLWTAIRLREADPGLDVVVVERDICGGGPSGRNSGMLLSAWTKLAGLTALRNEADALRVVDLSVAAIDGIEQFCAQNHIDSWFDRVGWVWGATCQAQNGAWNGALKRYERLGRRPAGRVTRDEIAAMTGSSAFLAGAFDASAATVHPGFLVRGLRRVALERGVRIYEKTTMTSFTRRAPLIMRTSRGQIRCNKIVLAMNAWSASVPELSPALFNISSDDAASLPMPEELERHGYRRGPLMIDSRVFVAGWRVTRDGRLNVGVTGGHIGFGGLVDKRFHLPSRRVQAMRDALRAGHPALADFGLDNAWNGPIDRTDSGLPLFGCLPGNRDILYGYGFSGNGIGMTFLGGHILASLLLGRDDEWADLPLARSVRRGFPPEPFRFVGAHFVRGAVRRRDRMEHLGRRPDILTNWLAGLAPSGVTPSKANIGSKE